MCESPVVIMSQWSRLLRDLLSSFSTEKSARGARFCLMLKALAVSHGIALAFRDVGLLLFGGGRDLKSGVAFSAIFCVWLPCRSMQCWFADRHLGQYLIWL